MADEKHDIDKLLDLLKPFARRLKLPSSKRGRVILGSLLFSVAGLIIFACLPIFTNTERSSVLVPYTKQTVQDSSIELNDSKKTQVGVNGEKTVTYKISKSLFNMLFGGESDKIVISTTKTKAPIVQITSIGTKKYQYMYCSNGAYRYYTNDQFKSPTVGFTHKSIDYCAKYNQGTETQLADSAPGSESLPSSYKPISNFTIPNCTTTSIPYGIDYKSVSWLPSGQTQTYSGLNGTYFSCLGTTVQPLNEVVYTGTGTTYNTAGANQARALARQQCTSEYNSAMARINAAGAGSSSAVQVVGQLYAQCLDSAG